MNGTLNKVMLIGYLGDEVKMHYFDAEIVLVVFNWLQTKSMSIKLLMKNNFDRVAQFSSSQQSG
jgi:hypothetical protein